MLERKYSFDASGVHEEDNGSRNMIIHGDNLEALKALLPRYEGKVKCIYIDPPYNTGNEGWVYNDNVNDPKIKKWLGEVVGKEGDDLSRHDKWLCMMYPRLRLLQKLLSNEGAILISIDDNELCSLKFLCDEIFGLNNFVNQFVWYTEGHTDNQESITHVHEYVLCYAKQRSLLKFNQVIDPAVPQDSKIRRDMAENSITKNGDKNPVSVIELPIGFPCELQELTLPATENAEELYQEVQELGYISRELTQKYRCSYPVRKDEMVVRGGVLQAPCQVYSGWASRKKLERFISGGCIPYEDGGGMLGYYLSRNGVIYYQRKGRSASYIQSVLEHKGTTEKNRYLLEKMGVRFDYPKPLELVSYLVSIFAKDGDIVLDSFAGSATTAHAVLLKEIADRESLRFVLIEMGDYAESVTAERVKRVITGYGEGNKAVAGTGSDFSFYELGERLLDAEGQLNPSVGTDKIRAYIWFMEARTDLPEQGNGNPYFLGNHGGSAFYFYYEKEAVTTLNYDFLATIPERVESYVIYADRCALSAAELQRFHLTFKKIPRDITKL